MRLLFRGPVLTASGYGVHARQLLRAVVDSGKYDVRVESIKWGETPFLNSDLELEWIHPLVERQQQDPGADYDVSIQVTIPNEFRRCARLNIGVTAGIEVDRVSPEWLLKCNSEVDVVVVPSHHSRAAFGVVYQAPDGKQLGLERPIFVVPEAVHQSFLSEEGIEPSEFLDGVPERNLIFVGLGLDKPGGQDRKNVTKLIEWFCKAFAGNESVGLVLKTSIVNGSLIDFETVKRRIAEIKGSTGCGEFPKIRLLHGRMTERQMAHVYHDARIVGAVSLTHGEGYGLPLIEAASVGLPIVATDWSGHLDFLTIDGVKHFEPVAADIAEIPDACVWPGVMEKGTRWAYPRQVDSVVAMQRLLESPQPVEFVTRANALAEHIRKNYSLETVCAQFSSLLDQLVEQAVEAQPRTRGELVDALRRRFPAGKESVVLTMPMSAGDVYLSSALIEYLRFEHEGKKIVLATLPQYREIAEGTWDDVIEWQPWMQDVSILEDVFSAAYTPNLAIQMTHSNWVRGGKGRNILEEMATQCGLQTRLSERSTLRLDPQMAAGEPCKAVEQLVEHVAKSKKLVAVHAGAGKGQWGARRYRHWDEVVHNLKRAGAVVVQVGGKDDLDVKGIDVDLRGKTSYRQLPQALKNCSALVCIDSFPMHVAHRIGVPVVALFGSSYPQSTGPIPDGKTRLVLLETKDRYGCERACYKNECVVDRDHPCVNEIDPAEVCAQTILSLGKKIELEYESLSPKISGYTHVLNPKTFGYPYKESIASMLGFCDEVIVVDGGSTDGSIKELEQWQVTEAALASGRLKVIKRDWDPNEPAMDGMQKAFGRAMCSQESEFLWQQDADEVVHEDDYEKIKRLAKRFPSDAKLLHLPVVELWGNERCVRTDRHSWKWRMSRNDFRITHGIHVAARTIDQKTGRVHAKKGQSDGCEYIDVVTGEYVPHAGFYSRELEELRVRDPYAYGNKMNQLFEELPSVFHYSWCDLPRKIRNFRDFWDKQWSVLHGTPPEPRFPDVKDDQDVVEKATEMFNRGGEHGQAKLFPLKRSNPAVMREWLSNAEVL